MGYLEVGPAYGRDYKSQSAVKSDWSLGKDFQDQFSGSYINKQDAERMGLKVLVRYAKGLKVVPVN